ncbi:Mannan endo-1,4-beta-mannosidase 7 [Hibiscus syriacus]|uniref:mannan endo-1,4-beta-mannosidase n=1 Tax=Hibiscus syriacus TaxID=106335 RepID=A0A6A3CMC3_HIBSY|nr:Mannan endo-1,4-beta-mannosidase 7 [Hibiscus syriacus]
MASDSSHANNGPSSPVTSSPAHRRRRGLRQASTPSSSAVTPPPNPSRFANSATTPTPSRDGGDRPLQYSPGSYNELMFQGLDFVVSEAKRYGIKLVLSFANNYDQFGGKKQYVNWARNQGQSIGPADDFFTNSVVKEYYKNHINTVLIRRNTLTGVAYKDEPTIMAWELMNEPRCLSDPSGNTMQEGRRCRDDSVGGPAVSRQLRLIRILMRDLLIGGGVCFDIYPFQVNYLHCHGIAHTELRLENVHISPADRHIKDAC